jgi:hypothetical protein
LNAFNFYSSDVSEVVAGCGDETDSEVAGTGANWYIARGVGYSGYLSCANRFNKVVTVKHSYANF